jgi:antitoxin YefM
MINTKTTLSISDARKHIFDIADKVQVPSKVYTLTSDGRPKAVIISAEEYESLIETLEVVRECPDILARSAESEKAMRTGNWKNFTTLDQLEKEWEMTGKKKKINGVLSHNRGKGKKRAR